MRTAAKRDANEPDIRRALEAAGYTVFLVSDGGIPDLLVTRKGKPYVLIEVKVPGKELTRAQERFFELSEGTALWVQDPQAYGRTAADDAGFEAAFLAKELGRPVRVQWTRQEETAWDTKGPAYAVKMRGALDAQGTLVALSYDAIAADHNHLGYNETIPC